MIVYFVVILTVLLGFCGLAVDVGRIQLRTNQLQAAADAGALAGAGELMHSSNTSTAGTAAYNDIAQLATANGFPIPTVGGQIGSTFGFYVGDNSVVEVQLTQPVSTIFLGLLSRANSSLTLSVKADAQMPPCALFMGNPTTTAGTDFDFAIASSSMHPPIGCPTYFKDGFSIDGFANIAGSQVRTAGTAGNSVISGWTSYPTIYTVPAIPDPLAYVVTPIAGTCLNSNPIRQINQSSSTTITFTPGTYCGKTAAYTGIGLCNTNASTITPAIDIQGNQMTYNNGTGAGCPNQSATNGGNCLSTPTVNFTPGLYIIVGGINFNCVTVTSSSGGATLYFTQNGTVGFGTFRMISSTWNLNAPTDSTNGGIAGVSVLNDRNWTPSIVGATQDFQWTYGTYNADGVIYLTKTGLDAYALHMSAPTYLNLVVANMYNYLAAVYPANNYANLPAGNPLRLYPTLVQ